MLTIQIADHPNEQFRELKPGAAPAAVPGLDVGWLAVHDGVDMRQRHRNVNIQLCVRLIARAPLLLLRMRTACKGCSSLLCL